jgi:hypothetical protein
MSGVRNEHELKEAARQYAVRGLEGFALAFNHLQQGELAWRFDEDVQQRFVELGREMIRLFEDGAIRSNPGHDLHLRARAAQRDLVLQRVLQRAAKKTPIRARSASPKDTAP